MKQVTAFEASDGTLFATEDACKEYEFSLLWIARIEEFNKSGLNPYPSGAQAGMCKKTILAWERFKAGA